MPIMCLRRCVYGLGKCISYVNSQEPRREAGTEVHLQQARGLQAHETPRCTTLGSRATVLNREITVVIKDTVTSTGNTTVYDPRQ